MNRRLLNLVAPVTAIVFAVALSSVILLASGHSPWTAYRSMWDYGIRTESIISIVNRAIPLYLAAMAVAIGFKMNLFNIGVEGQYRIAALLAAAFGAWLRLPPLLEVPLIILLAMVVGGAWAAVPAVLKVTRGVHEVISTIMLNFIATSLGAYLLSTYLRDKDPNSLVTRTKDLPKAAKIPSLNRPLTALGVHIPVGSTLRGFLIVAIAVGVLFYVVVWRTRFGYDLRASGTNPVAAQASGVNAKAMIVKTMIISGALAGLVGMGDLLGFYYKYSIDFPTGFGFTGIAVALLGRNHPAGMAFGALLFAYLDRSAQILDLRGIPREIVTIMQGMILLSVVVAYEVTARMTRAAETRAAAEATKELDEVTS